MRAGRWEFTLREPLRASFLPAPRWPSFGRGIILFEGIEICRYWSYGVLRLTRHAGNSE